MRAAACFCKHKLFDKFPCSGQEGNQVKSVISMMAHFGEILRLFYLSQLVLKKRTNGNFSGKVPPLDAETSDIDELTRNDPELWKFFVLRSKDDGHFQTPIDVYHYPKTKEIFTKDFFAKHKCALDDSHIQFLSVYPLPSSSNTHYLALGEFQTLVIGYMTSVEHPNEISNAVQYKRVRSDSALFRLSRCWCEIVKQYRSYKSVASTASVEELKKLAFEIYYLFVNILPFLRGSAGAGKVLLNSCLSAFDQDIVRETPEYQSQADWFAFAANNFEEFYSQVHVMFTT